MYQRGFEYSAKATDQLALDGEKVKIDGRIGRPLKAVWKDDDDIKHEKEIHGATAKPFDFHYIWVAESPANEDGEPNPHVHVLLNWRIEPHHFAGWAQRIEQLWGNGMAHLEKIKFSEAAAGYLIKAVGYAAKGDNADQGLIKGNRYNIARCSRAPDWDVLASFDVDNMTGIIKECGYRLEQWRKPMLREITRKQTRKDDAIRAIDINRKKGKFDAVQKLNHLIKKLDHETREIRERLKSRGVFASSLNQFSIAFEGENANHKADQFLWWAAGARNWSLRCHDIEMHDIKAQSVERYQEQFQRFLDRQANWKAQLRQEVPPEPDYQLIKSDSMAEYHDYCQHIKH
ncbi:hypothetical protein ACOMICROBIO_EPCKBFOG_01458 [Vibrio sp. B1FLJ16]|nr:hypothetical protein [Vibrio sp. B1FLJ16]CAD7805962.1 hypothetical protein ACOMICROBIO_EPCKBFOG_01458 [Vibrio sp. B1FLJ16]CAE6902043.1 hypothetical protein ACOMICROBIO_EPCKBFOG_01458 [Vibrio sp. B1FLJ16]